MSIGVLKRVDLEKTIFIGELSLDGKINKANGILPVCIEAKNMGIERIIIPESNAEEASLVPGIEIIGVDNLKDVINYINGNLVINPKKYGMPKMKRQIFNIDFSDVRGQLFAKRALEIAIAGGHNCLLMGTPGSGKTMMIERVPTILPELSLEEAVEITKIYSVSGMLKNSIVADRPFRMPHHTITKTALIGGGRNPKPGEISLAHYGVLFLDELLEFKKEVIEALRGPLEDNNININRVGTSTNYPCNFTLIASANPCPCGYYGSGIKECTCSEIARKNYVSKLSGPMLDRFDMQINVFPAKHEEIEDRNGETSATIKERINKAREIQKARYRNETIHLNSELKSDLIEKYCKLDDASLNLLNRSYKNFAFSTRAYYKILKVARTIADLEESKKIEMSHILEAIQYRNKERNEL